MTLRRVEPSYADDEGRIVHVEAESDDEPLDYADRCEHGRVDCVRYDTHFAGDAAGNTFVAFGLAYADDDVSPACCEPLPQFDDRETGSVKRPSVWLKHRRD